MGLQCKAKLWISGGFFSVALRNKKYLVPENLVFCKRSPKPYRRFSCWAKTNCSNCASEKLLRFCCLVTPAFWAANTP